MTYFGMKEGWVKNSGEKCEKERNKLSFIFRYVTNN